MTKRKKNIVFVPFDDDEYQFYVWSDLKESDFAKVEGISRVVEGYGGPNQACVFADPRYDVAEVQAEITALAEAAARPTDAEQKTSRWHVTAGNDRGDAGFTVMATGFSDAALKAEKQLSDNRMDGSMPCDYEIINLEWSDW